MIDWDIFTIRMLLTVLFVLMIQVHLAFRKCRTRLAQLERMLGIDRMGKEIPFDQQLELVSIKTTKEEVPH
jgi:hypothetical protein